MEPGNDIPFNSRSLSRSKRDVYLQFIDLLKRSSAEFVLAANIAPNDKTGDCPSPLKLGH
jgi:hypothetical protein